MGATLTAMAFIAVSVVAGVALGPRVVPMRLAMRAALVWLVVTPIVFLSPSAFLALAACGVVLAAFTPRLEDRAAFYIMTLPAVASGLAAQIPFPGINYLMDIDFAKAAALALLVPAIAMSKPAPAGRYAPLAGALFALMTALFFVQEFRAANLTSSLRAGVDFALHFLVPLFALTRFIRTREDFERALAGFVFIGAVFVFAGVISQAVKWNFFTHAAQRYGNIGINAFHDYRGGFLRVGVSVNTVLCGYIAALCLLAVEYFRGEKKIGFLPAMLWRGALLLLAFMTWSRGAWLSLAASVSIYYFFTMAPRMIRPIFVAGGVFVILFGLSWVLTADFGRVDEYGTFAYRQELLRASLEQVAARPLFGDANYLESGRFDHLYTGMGIIDVVNYYLQIALEHGLVGLGLYLGAFIAAIAGLLSLGARVKETGSRTLERQRAVMLGALCGYLLLIGTTSAVSLVSHYGVMLLGLATALVAATRAEAARERVQSASAPEETAEPEPEPAQAAAPARPARPLPVHLRIWPHAGE